MKKEFRVTIEVCETEGGFDLDKPVVRTVWVEAESPSEAVERSAYLASVHETF